VVKEQGQRFTLAGSINTVRGFYQFQGRRFDVTRDGRIRFAGLSEINPLIDVTAIRVINGVEARVHISGTARAPKLTLSSTPPMDEADILSLIVFNASINSLGTDEEELWRGTVRVEVKSGHMDTMPVDTRYRKMRDQSDASRAIGDNRPFAAVCMPPGSSDGIVMIRLSEVFDVAQALLEAVDAS